MIQQRALFLTQAAVIAALSILHITALQYSLYFYLPWLDVLSHFLGGLWVSLIVAWLFLRFAQMTPLLRIALITLMVSVLWEVFELAAGVPREANFVLDTSIDLTMDTIGLCVGLYSLRFLTRYA